MNDSVVKSSELQDTIRELYAVIAKLEGLYPKRHFTPDGHLVGSLGEVYASETYGITLYEASHPVYDGWVGDRQVQIKCTQGTRIALGECPNYLIVLQLSKAGTFEEIYNGPGRPIWEMRGKPQKTSQYQIALSKLREADCLVDPSERIARVDS